MNFSKTCIWAVSLLLAGAVSAKNVKVNYVVTNPDNEPRKDEPVVIPVSASWV